MLICAQETKRSRPPSSWSGYESHSYEVAMAGVHCNGIVLLLLTRNAQTARVRVSRCLRAARKIRRERP